MPIIVAPGWILPTSAAPVMASTPTKTGRIKVNDVVRYYGQARKYTVEAIDGAEAVLRYTNERQETRIVNAPLCDLIVHVEEPKPVRKR